MADPGLLSGMAFIAVGAAAGLLGAFFGVGGGWFVTPMLLLAGMSASSAVGTGMTFLFVTGVTGSIRHARAERLDLRLGATLAGCMVVGVEVGRRILAILDRTGSGETSIQWMFVAFLSVLGFTMFRGARTTDTPRTGSPPPTRHSLGRMIGVGGAAGILSGILGIGGGFFLVPAMIHLMGVEDRAAVATSLFGIAVAGLWGSIAYGAGGHIHAPIAACLALGSLAGVPAGVRACRRIDARRFRGLFGGMLLAAATAAAAAALGWTATSRTLLILAAATLLTVIGISSWRSQERRREWNTSA